MFPPVIMSTQPAMVPGRVYRTRELRAFSANPSRWAKHLVEQGVLRQPHHGLFYLPVQSRFGPVGVTDEELLHAFLGTGDFLITGPDVWNALGLGTTQLFAVTLVYNAGRTGEVELGGRRFCSGGCASRRIRIRSGTWSTCSRTSAGWPRTRAASTSTCCARCASGDSIATGFGRWPRSTPARPFVSA
jgi:hypothetical protein